MPDQHSRGTDAGQRDARHALLLAERQRTEAQIASLARDFDDIVAAAASSNTDDEHDPEGATIAFERSQVSALIAQARSRLAALQHAEEALQDGTYGICERCGGAISAGRLEARPAATTCIACASAG